MTRRPILLLLAATALAAAPGASAQQDQQSCDCEAEKPVTLAVVNDVPIPTSTVEADAAPLVGPIQQLMDQVRERALQSLITNRLIDLEATKRGVSTTKLIQDEVVGKAGEPTDAEL